MNLKFNQELISQYRNNSQIARVLTEDWVKHNSFCPNCGNEVLNQFANNKPVADFSCVSCQQEYELKSKNGSLGDKINDGAYSTMINRIQSDNNPNFFFLTYNKANWTVRNFLIIPKHYFIKELIEERKPLAITAKRAGWIGCNILLNSIPSSGRIFLVKDASAVNKEIVLSQWQQTCFLKGVNQAAKGWLIDVLNCIETVPKQTFSLDEIYHFETALKVKHPENNFIKDKIRQQLQVLRDKGFIEFVSRGLYKKLL